MKVTNNPVQSSQTSEAQSAKRSERARPSSASRTERSGAPVDADSANAEISAKGKEFAHAREIANAAPDTRDARIEELKKRIASGQYHVDADAVADKMIHEHLSSGL